MAEDVERMETACCHVLPEEPQEMCVLRVSVRVRVVVELRDLNAYCYVLRVHGVRWRACGFFAPMSRRVVHNLVVGLHLDQRSVSGEEIMHRRVRMGRRLARGHSLRRCLLPGGEACACVTLLGTMDDEEADWQRAVGLSGAHAAHELHPYRVDEDANARR